MQCQKIEQEKGSTLVEKGSTGGSVSRSSSTTLVRLQRSGPAKGSCNVHANLAAADVVELERELAVCELLPGRQMRR